MVEPLTNSASQRNFTGKSYNTHPQWYNQPLRLTREQKHNPVLILDDFFECYHLHEVREILWDWLVEVVSSPHSISSNPTERSNHIFFYEKIEAVVEACFIIQKKSQKQNQQRRNKFPVIERGQHQGLYNKPIPLIEKPKTDPLYVIQDIFDGESLSGFRDYLHNWLNMALANDGIYYTEAEQRAQLITFHEELQILIEALAVIYTGSKDRSFKSDKPVLLNEEQIADPQKVIAGFFNKFTMTYIRREIDDWLYEGMGYDGPLAENMSKLDILLCSRDTLCLIKSAFWLLKKEKVMPQPA